MLDGLLGRGFGSKCKSLVKLTKSRIEVIRRKRKATQKFLKKDIADLLANGLDINAYGRADGLLVELTVTSCYDYIDQTCDFVLKHLSVIQKQSECPEECREAVSSLMFAAARFSDLPELRDLRQMFHERYGDSLEYFANKEFAEKLSSKPAEMESKVQLMQDIALEFSIRWDSTAFQQRMSNPSVSAQGQNKNYGLSHANADNNRSVNRKDSASKGDRHQFAYKEGHDLPPKYDYSPRDGREGHGPKRNEIDLQPRRQVSENGHTSLNGAKETVLKNYGRSMSFQGGQESKVEKLGHWIQKEDTSPRKVISGSSSRRNGQIHADERLNLQYGKEEVHNTTKRNEQNKEADKLRPYYNNAIPPPYVKPYSKPKEDKYGANPRSTHPDFGSNGVAEESSSRDRANTGNRSDRVQLHDHSSDHERHAGLVRMNGHDNEKDRHHHQDGVTGDDDPLRKVKSVRRRHTRSRSNHDVGDFEETPVPARKLRTSRRDDPRRGLQVLFGDERDDKDEEERVIDRLLMHYSKKPTFEPEKMRRKHKSRRPQHESPDVGQSQTPRNDKTKNRPREEPDTTHAPLRSSSLPKEQSAAPSQTPKVFARASSFQHDGSNPARHVHPKLPDYDDLAARFASLRGK